MLHLQPGLSHPKFWRNAVGPKTEGSLSAAYAIETAPLRAERAADHSSAFIAESIDQRAANVCLNF
jgi:hypothetical protein